MSVSAVIVHYANPLVTERFIETLLGCSDIQRIVVIVHGFFPVLSRPGNVEWIDSENRGYAAGLNRAMKHLLLSTDDDSQLMLALNPDVRIDSRTIQNLIAEHCTAQADCTFPVIREKNRLIYGYRFSRFGALKTSKHPEWYSGACFLLSGSAWKKAGGFDESYFHYFEDRDFCLRMRNAGLQCYQASQIVVEHEGKSGADYPATELPKYAVRNHLIALERSQRLGPVSFLNVTSRHFAYLFRWKKGWRGIPKWRQGIKEFVNGSVVK